MIWFQLRLHNPWYRESNSFRPLWFRSWRLGKHKSLEMQLCSDSLRCLFGMALDTRWTGHDHGGLMLELELLGYGYSMQLYDNRHWDHKNHCWV